MAKRPTAAQAQALDRVLYLLEAKSFQRLAGDNLQFAKFIHELYQRIGMERANLTDGITER